METIRRPLLFEILVFCPVAVFSVEVTAKSLREKLVSDLQYYATFVKEAWNMDVRHLNLRRIKGQIREKLNAKVFAFVDYTHSGMELNLETGEVEKFTVEMEKPFNPASSWCSYLTGMMITGGLD
jgi:hypothetical protein